MNTITLYHIVDCAFNRLYYPQYIGEYHLHDWWQCVTERVEIAIN